MGPPLVPHAAEVEVEQQEDDQHGDRHDDLQRRLGALQVLELAAPGDVVAGRELNLARQATPAGAIVVTKRFGMDPRAPSREGN